MNSERDEHFKGFAKLLLDEIKEKYAWVEPFQGDGSDLDDLERYIAQRAYDLVYQSIEFFRYSPNIRPMQLSSTETWIHFLPDLTEWPKIK